jgi:hypothetical protein
VSLPPKSKFGNEIARNFEREFKLFRNKKEQEREHLTAQLNDMKTESDTWKAAYNTSERQLDSETDARKKAQTALNCLQESHEAEIKRMKLVEIKQLGIAAKRSMQRENQLKAEQGRLKTQIVNLHQWHKNELMRAREWHDTDLMRAREFYKNRNDEDAVEFKKVIADVQHKLDRAEAGTTWHDHYREIIEVSLLSDDLDGVFIISCHINSLAFSA